MPGLPDLGLHFYPNLYTFLPIASDPLHILGRTPGQGIYPNQVPSHYESGTLHKRNIGS